ncbi:hypothetical protein BpHYR1_042638 [Brachionus plicatilis]|uniref:Uncharacterized protein n=1 Tax=Brachionus plicatilis TaxID=10195 RepID=A0A3M7T7S2_BRAPC|nr:hypothetical protein BpHYR1_042638 [Brachionus plicatilis]
MEEKKKLLSNLNNNEENSIARDVSVNWRIKLKQQCLNGKSINQKRFQMANHSLRAPSIFNLDTNVDIWLARFDNYLELKRIFGNRDKINVLGSFLDDTTFKLVDSLINERSYDEVKTKFRALFSRPESSAHVLFHTFVGRGQELNESLVQYAAVLQELGRKAIPDLNLRELDI